MLKFMYTWAIIVGGTSFVGVVITTIVYVPQNGTSFHSNSPFPPIEPAERTLVVDFDMHSHWP